ncbi:MAG: MOSC N-terminal beta barrel domain-containing protein [Tepidiformaceae bacterium]
MTVGILQTIARYPVKSMRGEELSSCALGYQGLPRDRGYAFVRDGLHNAFPWLTGREHRGLLACQPVWEEVDGKERLFVQMPEGARLPIESDELRRQLEQESGVGVRLHSDYRGSQDVAYVSLIYGSTIRALATAGDVVAAHQRFRMNFVIENDAPAFSEKELVGKTLGVGEAEIVITHEDRRCVMITFDPESGASTPAVLKFAGRQNATCAGVYAAVLRAGVVNVGDEVTLAPAGD